MSDNNEFHVYRDVPVSGVAHDFSLLPHDRIPHRLYADWAALLVKLARAVFPAFEPPLFPAALVFHTESIHSDGPYSADADYYFLDYVSFEFKSQNGHGIKISYENGRWGGGEPVNLETLGIGGSDVSSSIGRESSAPLATVYLRHGAEKSSEIREIIARHLESCRRNRRKWTTRGGTFLVQKKLNPIPFIYGGVGLEDGARFDDASEYVETTASGEIIKRYSEPLPFGIKDEMTVSNIHRVIGDRFYEFYYCQPYGYEPKIQATLLMSGLDLYEGVLPFAEENLFE